MLLEFSPETPKELIFESVKDYLQKQKLKIEKFDNGRPWGGFFVIDEIEADKFVSLYFNSFSTQGLKISGKLSPKILIVAPHQRLSWQFHHRRAEIWKLIGGTAGVITSDNDIESNRINLNIGDIIQLKQGERHRLIGLDAWGIVAEIWRHTDHTNPSDEDDIIRLQDDFGR